MPMKEDSTQRMDELEEKKRKNRNGKRSMPRRQTLDFLSQFARIYHSEPVLGQELCGLVMN